MHGEPGDHPLSSNSLSFPLDITPQLSFVPPDLAANWQTPLDLLNLQAGMPPGLVDLNEGVASDSSQIIRNITRGMPDVDAGQWSDHGVYSSSRDSSFYPTKLTPFRPSFIFHLLS